MNRILKISTALLVVLAFSALPVMAFKAPTITLERVEVASMQPFFMTKAQIKDNRGKPFKGGAVLNTAYILNIKNPNKTAVKLDELSFTIAFDGFDVNTVTSYEDSWIPAGKTNQLRVIATNETLPTLLSLLVAAPYAERLKKMNTKAPAMVKKWWDEIENFSFPIEIKNGTAVFEDEKGKTVRANFAGKFGGKK